MGLTITDLAGGFSVPTVPDYVELTWTPSDESVVSLYYGYIDSDPGDLSSASLADLVGMGMNLTSIPTDWTNVGFTLDSDYIECHTFYFVLLERIIGTDQCSNVTISISACDDSTCYNCKGLWATGKGVGGKSIPRV